MQGNPIPRIDVNKWIVVDRNLTAVDQVKDGMPYLHIAFK